MGERGSAAEAVRWLAQHSAASRPLLPPICFSQSSPHAGTSACIAESCGDAADGGGDGAVQLGCVFAGALAAEHVDLDQVHGVDIGIAQLDRVREDAICFEQLCLAG